MFRLIVADRNHHINTFSECACRPLTVFSVSFMPRCTSAPWLFYCPLMSLRGAHWATTLAPHASAGEQSCSERFPPNGRLLRAGQRRPRNDGKEL